MQKYDPRNGRKIQRSQVFRTSQGSWKQRMFHPILWAYLKIVELSTFYKWSLFWGTQFGDTALTTRQYSIFWYFSRLFLCVCCSFSIYPFCIRIVVITMTHIRIIQDVFKHLFYSSDILEPDLMCWQTYLSNSVMQLCWCYTFLSVF